MRHFPNRQRRHGLVVYQLVLILIVLIILIILLVHFARTPSSPAAGGTASESAAGALAGDSGVFPVLATRPVPKEITFKGCPPEGDGGDAALNRLKNRVDDGERYAPIPFDSLRELRWPRTVDRRTRARWTRREREAVARYEGLPIAVEGYVADARREGPESPNCHGADAEFRDWHLWLTGAPGADRGGSVVVEVTPRVRDRRAAWQLDRLRRIARNRQRVRVSGWLMLDQEHPEQLGRTRGTLWEIHPIMRIDVQRRGRWVALDSLPSSTRTGQHAQGDSAQGDVVGGGGRRARA